MILSDIIKSNSWLSVRLTLEKLIPDQEEFLDDYEKVFNELRIMQALPGKITIDVKSVHDTYDDSHYVDVSGYYTNPAERTNEYSNSLAIEFVPWNEWLGMPIDETSLKNFSELEIIAFCLHEMTYAGFEQEEIQSEIDKIKSIKDEYESLSPDEKEKRTYTLDELKEKLGWDFDEKEEDDNDNNSK